MRLVWDADRHVSRRGDFVLPPAFDLVVLSQGQKSMLINYGKNPGRLERDRDAEGNVVNTEYYNGQ